MPPKKSAKDVSELHFYQLLQGSVTCWHRPTPQQIEQLARHTPCTMVVTCQGAGESPGDIKTACSAHGLQWVWVKMTGANQALMGAAHFQQPVIAGLVHTKAQLLAGAHVLIHCAAGIHRTGFFLYSLLRICGHSPAEAHAALEEIRHVTAVQAGSHRLELAESLVQRLLDQGLPVEQLRNAGCTLRVSFLSQGSLVLMVVALEGEHCEEIARHAISIAPEVAEKLPRKLCSPAPSELQIQEPLPPPEAEDQLLHLIYSHSSGPFVPTLKPGSRVFLETFFPKFAQLLYPSSVV